MRLSVFVFLPFCLSACASSPQESAVSTLDALKACPPSETTCVTMTANLHWPVRGGIAIQEHPAVLSVDERVQNGGYGSVVIVVTGRLNGGAQGEYRLRIAYPNDMQNCNDFLVAALGAKSGGGGTILTQQGNLEILSSEIVIGSWTTVGLVNVNRGTISYALAPDWEKYSWDGALAVTQSGEMFWRVRGRCLDLNEGDRFRTVPVDKCQALRLTPASEADVTRVKGAKLFDNVETNERLQFDLWRAEGSPNLVYIWSAACT
jgi:hypothetical protein